MKFTSEFFAGNRKRLRTSCPRLNGFMFASNGLLQRSADTTYPFGQESNFWYLTGLDEPDMWLYMAEDSDYLVISDRDAHRDLWEGAIDGKQLTQKSGVEKVITKEELKQLLMKRKNKVVGCLPVADAYIHQLGMYTNPHRSQLHEFLNSLKLETEDVRLHLARLRQVKQKPELQAIETAVNITVKSLMGVKDSINDFKAEDQLERELSARFLQMGSRYHAYAPIVASGKNAATIHYVKNDSKLQKNQLVLLDVGAEYQGYASDISRTWAVGKAAEEQKILHAMVMDIQTYAFGLLKPGVLIRDYEKQVADYAAKQALKNKLITKASDIRSIFPHATSHFLGLDVHDAADYDKPLEPNMVLTVEPGVYLPELGIGIRIEDDVVITEKGIKNLSASLTRNL